jgi:hypothetical protein
MTEKIDTEENSEYLKNNSSIGILRIALESKTNY